MEEMDTMKQQKQQDTGIFIEADLCLGDVCPLLAPIVFIQLQ